MRVRANYWSRTLDRHRDCGWFPTSTGWLWNSDEGTFRSDNYWRVCRIKRPQHNRTQSQGLWVRMPCNPEGFYVRVFKSSVVSWFERHPWAWPVWPWRFWWPMERWRFILRSSSSPLSNNFLRYGTRKSYSPCGPWSLRPTPVFSLKLFWSRRRMTWRWWNCSGGGLTCFWTTFWTTSRS